MKALFSKYPFVFLAISLVFGILSAMIVGWYGLTVLIFLLPFYFLKPSNYHNFLAIVLVFGVGVSAYYLNWDYKRKIDIGADKQTSFCKVEVNEVTNSTKKKKLSVDVLQSDNKYLKGYQLFIYADKSSFYDVGDVLLLEGRLIKFQKPTIPDQFDFEQYYNNHGYLAQVFVSGNELIKVGHHKSFNYYIERLRNHLRGNLDLLITNVQERAILKALVVGDRQELSKELKTVYVTAGIFHVLAVSGLHVGMMYFIIMLFVRLVPSKGMKLIVLILGLFFYSCLTGLSTSVIRAGVMFLFFGTAKIYQLKTSSINILVASCFFILVFKPNFVFESGFQLSISAVLGILLFFRRIEAWFNFKYWIFNQVWSLAAVSIAAQILTTPLILYYFHQFPTYFILINVVVVLLVQVALILGSLAAVLGDFYGVGDFLAQCAEWICYSINKMAIVVSNWPMSRVFGVHLEMFQVMYLMLAILCIHWFLVFKKRIFFYGSFGLMLVFVWMSGQRFMRYGNQDYLAFHKIKTTLVIEKVTGNRSTLYYEKNKLEEDEVRLTLVNYWSKRNISIQEVNPLVECLTLNNKLFMTNNKLDGDFEIKTIERRFKVLDKHGEIVFDSDSETSLVMMN